MVDDAFRKGHQVKRTTSIVMTAVIAAAAFGALAPAQAATPPLPKKPNGKQATTARVLAPVTARRYPTFRSRAVTVVQPIAPLGGGPTVLLVKQARRVDGRLWLRVLLPIRPNNAQGWIPADVARLQRNRTRIIIRQESRRLDLYRNGRRILRLPVAVGKPSTPTPYGRFAIAERIATNLPNGFLGPYVMPITGYSRVLNEYAGGNGRVAIHGTSEPRVIGTRASNGCIRLYNSDVRRLVRLVKPGTQVEIRRR
jgi:lipoprotein-anchoring transpeptidase ErfK/SrfK